jgi:hypothetical protein
MDDIDRMREYVALDEFGYRSQRKMDTIRHRTSVDISEDAGIPEEILAMQVNQKHETTVKGVASVKMHN